MNQARTPFQRILAIDPTYRGFGCVVVEEPERLVDWGVCQVRTEKRDRTLRKVADLIHHWEPNIVVVEATRHQHCRRGEHARDLVEAIAALARTMNVAFRRVPMATVREHYADLGATNKGAVARLVVDRFPELESFLPPRRKAWMPEDERMAIFDAMAMALVL
jgi:RNase H-fold protein (predicted Holliday junction resolvase)